MTGQLSNRTAMEKPSVSYTRVDMDSASVLLQSLQTLIAWPGVPRQTSHALCRDTFNVPAHRLTKLFYESPHQRGDVRLLPVLSRKGKY